MQELPKDPVMLLSFVNLKLRDYYKDIDSFCKDCEIEKQELTERLAAIDYFYDVQSNQFK